MALQEVEQAIPHLELIINTPKSYYQEEATWYGALAHLETTNVMKTKQLLEQLTQRVDGRYYQKATELLDKL